MTTAIRRVVAALGEWLRDPEHAELQRAFAIWLVQVLLPARMPGAVIPAIADLQEVKSMLAERVIEWTQEWTQEGFQEGHREGLQEGRQEGLQKGLQEGLQKGLQKGHKEGLQKGLQKFEKSLAALRSVLLRRLEDRFGPLSEATLRQIQAVDSMEKLGELLAESAVAPSLAALGLAGRAKKQADSRAKRP
jgi:flagellar biosynthesis/type III secretory pathway protein FliH